MTRFKQTKRKLPLVSKRTQMICVIMQLFTNKKQSNFLHVNFFENTFLKPAIKVEKYSFLQQK